jgi:hypothetical protein
LAAIVKIARGHRQAQGKEVHMAKPITGIPPFSGKDAKRFRDYLANAKPDPKKEAQAKADAEIYAKTKRVENVRCK